MSDKNKHIKSSARDASGTFEKDQDDLMNTLESIKSLLEQSEGKLNAARESISIANTNTKNDTSALMNIRNHESDDEIVPILDDIVEPENGSDSLINIPELDAVFTTPNTGAEIEPETVLASDIEIEDISIETEYENAKNIPNTTADLTSLTQKNLLIEALDDMQLELEQSLRETLMKTMVTLEKDLQDRISRKINQIKSDILK